MVGVVVMGDLNVHHHPWVDDGCIAAVERMLRVSTPEENVRARKVCMRSMRSAQRRHLERLHASLMSTSLGSKTWWQKAGELVGRQRNTCIPALRTGDGTWIVEAQSKAGALADGLLTKHLPDFWSTTSGALEMALMLPVP
jgi:hypothetical protein